VCSSDLPFIFSLSCEDMAFELIRDIHLPADVPGGQQTDSTGKVWFAVAHTPQGDIIAKAV